MNNLLTSVDFTEGIPRLQVIIYASELGVGAAFFQSDHVFASEGRDYLPVESDYTVLAKRCYWQL